MKKLLDYCKDDKFMAFIHLCGLFLDGDCDYMSKYSQEILKHMKHHKIDNISAVKVVEYYSVSRDEMIYKYRTEFYSDLIKCHSKQWVLSRIE